MIPTNPTSINLALLTQTRTLKSVQKSKYDVQESTVYQPNQNHTFVPPYAAANLVLSIAVPIFAKSRIFTNAEDTVVFLTAVCTRVVHAVFVSCADAETVSIEG